MKQNQQTKSVKKFQECIGLNTRSTIEHRYANAQYKETIFIYRYIDYKELCYSIGVPKDNKRNTTLSTKLISLIAMINLYLAISALLLASSAS